MEWHCSYFWEHALSKQMVERSKNIFDMLDQFIALPILLKMPLHKYEELANIVVSTK